MAFSDSTNITSSFDNSSHIVSFWRNGMNLYVVYVDKVTNELKVQQLFAYSQTSDVVTVANTATIL